MSGVTVRTSATGFPLAIDIEKTAMRLGAAHIAAEILLQCREASLRAAVQYRAQCAAAGVSGRTLDELGVPRDDARCMTPPTLEGWGFTR